VNKHTRKPLELTVFHRDEDGDYRHPLGFWIPQADADHWAEAKSFTDAELAAEYYAQDGQCRHEQWIEAVRGDDDYTESERQGQSRMYAKLTMLHRFATLPHYDEAAL
jgi:hypothetical protein